MIYEIKIAWRTLRQEGGKSLFNKLHIYFQQLMQGLVFLGRRIPRDTTVEESLDFGSQVADGLICSTQVRSEINQLAALIQQRRPRTVVEIGTANGGTLFLWCQVAHPEATIVSLDLPGGMHGGGYPYWKTWIYKRFPGVSQKLHLLRGDSHQPEMLTRLKNTLPGDGRVDFLFIDGDHTYEGVKTDFEMYSGLVRPGGLMAFHDICKHPENLNCHVDRFWQEVKNERRTREFVHDMNQGTCGIGVIEM
jgi:predicted O-methyltransferase YrrM